MEKSDERRKKDYEEIMDNIDEKNTKFSSLLQSKLSLLLKYRVPVILLIGLTQLAILTVFEEFIYPTNVRAVRASGIILLMAIYWMFEVIPLSATALIPLALFPIFGIMSAQAVSVEYFNDTIAILLGSNLLAIAMEKFNLHKRIALKLLLLIPPKPIWITLGFMVITAFLSMFMTNTGTTTLMAPLAISLVKQVEERNNTDNEVDEYIPDNNNNNNNNDNNDNNDNNNDRLIEEDDQEKKPILFNQSSTTKLSSTKRRFIDRYYIATLLAIAYSSSVGGISTPIGTGTNLAFLQLFEELFPLAPEISFIEWIIYSLPLAIIFLFIIWIYLSFIYLRYSPGEKKIDLNSSYFSSLLSQMGAIKYEELVIIIAFVCTAILWLTRSGLGNIPGWSSLFPLNVGNGTVAMIFPILLFMLPEKNRDGRENIFNKRILTWDDAHQVSWAVLLLLGGSFALAAGFQKSGLSEIIANELDFLEDFPVLLVIPMICLIVTITTEFMSNTAAVTVVTPILGSLAISIHQNPLLLMLPAVYSCSFAFMLPVSTPPNAVVFQYNKLTIWDMVKTGIILNILGVIGISSYVLLSTLFTPLNLNDIPDWAD